MTPPREASMVRIPVGRAASFDSSFALLTKSDRVATFAIETKKGDTPDRIAHTHGITSAALRAFNPKTGISKKTGRYVPGQTLTVPVSAVANAMRFVPDPSIEKFPKHKKAGVAKAKTKAASKPKKKSPAAKSHSRGSSKSVKKKS